MTQVTLTLGKGHPTSLSVFKVNDHLGNMVEGVQTAGLPFPGNKTTQAPGHFQNM